MHNHEPPGYICPLCQIAHLGEAAAARQARGEPTDRGSDEEFVLMRDETLTVFIAGKWWRTNPGHVIVIPNRHIENLYDMPPDIGHAVADMSRKVAIALKKAYGCDGTSTRQHNEPAGNQDVWHYHLHVFPRYAGDGLYVNHDDTYWPTAEEKRPYAEKLKRCFSKQL